MGKFITRTLIRLHLGVAKGDQPSPILTQGQNFIEFCQILQEHALHNRHMASVGRHLKATPPHPSRQSDFCSLAVGEHSKSLEILCKHEEGNTQSRCLNPWETGHHKSRAPLELQGQFMAILHHQT